MYFFSVKMTTMQKSGLSTLSFDLEPSCLIGSKRSRLRLCGLRHAASRIPQCPHRGYTMLNRCCCPLVLKYLESSIALQTGWKDLGLSDPSTSSKTLRASRWIVVQCVVAAVCHSSGYRVQGSRYHPSCTVQNSRFPHLFSVGLAYTYRHPQILLRVRVEL